MDTTLQDVSLLIRADYILLTSLPAFSTLYIIWMHPTPVLLCVAVLSLESILSKADASPVVELHPSSSSIIYCCQKGWTNCWILFICRALLIKEFQLYRKEYIVCLGNTSWTGGGIRSLYHCQRAFFGPTQRNFYKTVTKPFQVCWARRPVKILSP